MTTGPARPVMWLDWSKHQVGKRSGKCVLCGQPALMRDELGKPRHKTCEEQRIGAAGAAYEQITTPTG